jgi:hypothetical protein
MRQILDGSVFERIFLPILKTAGMTINTQMLIMLYAAC